jgi:hypothetical protein
MNRLEFLKDTIFMNLELIETFNLLYKDTHKFELSLCNYDSKDDLDYFVNTELNKYLNSDFFIYTKIENKNLFQAAHAKNIAHKQSNGDILINLDADNTLSIIFMNYIIELFENDMNIVTVGTNSFNKKGSYGRVCLSRENFYKLGGYNEMLYGYGGEDYGLIIRSEAFLKCNLIALDYDILNVIEHSDRLRLLNNLDVNFTDEYYDKFNDEDSDILRLKSKINEDIENCNIENNIMNPNEFNNIIFGSY